MQRFTTNLFLQKSVYRRFRHSEDFGDLANAVAFGLKLLYLCGNNPAFGSLAD